MLDGIHKIHMIGIGGIGMSAVAKLLREKGKSVGGSDMHCTEITEDLVLRGMQVHCGHAPENVPADSGLVIFSSAVPEENPERKRATELGVRQISYAEFLGELSKEYSTMVVTGTHGKSTTTALLGLMLEAAGYDPTVIVGSKVSSFPMGNLRVGGGRFLVLEGCEHNANILHLNPEAIVVTNIELDHPDFYRDIDHLRETFQQFVDKLKGKGLVVLNADDPESRRLTATRPVRFGMDTEADYVLRNRETEQGAQSALLARGEEELGTIELKIPGVFNMMNALAATAMAMELGVTFEACVRVLADFPGVWRRFERVGTWQGADVISDYGHHPTALAATLQGAREFFPGRRIILCFQPHQHSRTKELFDEFAQALAHGADHIILVEIYRVAGRTEDESVSSRDLVEAVKKIEPAQDIRYAEDFDAAESELRDIVKEHDVVIVMGAGDVDDVARKIAE